VVGCAPESGPSSSSSLCQQRRQHGASLNRQHVPRRALIALDLAPHHHVLGGRVRDAGGLPVRVRGGAEERDALGQGPCVPSFPTKNRFQKIQRIATEFANKVCNRGPNSDVKADFKNSFSIFFAPTHESQFKLPSDFRGLAQKDGLGCLVCQFESIRQGGKVTPKLFKKVDEIIKLNFLL
jgi:hypothetical protein